jgi:hypothetical protein
MICDTTSDRLAPQAVAEFGAADLAAHDLGQLATK